MTANAYERVPFESTTEAYFPTAQIPDVQLIEAEEKFHSDPDYAPEIEIEMTVPSSGEMTTHLLSAGVESDNDNLDFWTETGKAGTQLTKITSSGTVGANEVRIYENSDRFDVATSRAGTSVFATIKCGAAALTSWLMRQVIAELRAIGEVLIRATVSGGIGKQTIQATAGEAISAGDFVYLVDEMGTTVIYLADATDWYKCAMGFCESAIDEDAAGTVMFSGYTTALSALQPHKWLYLHGAAGGYVDDYGDLSANEYMQPLAQAISASKALIKIGHPTAKAV